MRLTKYFVLALCLFFSSNSYAILCERIFPEELAWDMSQKTFREFSKYLYRMDNFFYYQGVQVLAKANMLVAGPGGGAKTFSAVLLFDAQMNAMLDSMKSIDKKTLDNYSKDIDGFLEAVQVLVEEDLKKNPEQRTFTLQMHQMLSDGAILGTLNPLKLFNENKYEYIDDRAVVAKNNFFVILDEIEKAPVAIQMMLLEIMVANDRKLSRGNQILELMIESVIATTNASLDELIAQAKSYELGGRTAFIDRLILKFHMMNTGSSAKDDLHFIKAAKMFGENEVRLRRMLIDLRSIRPLMEKVKVDRSLVQAISELTLTMDSYYTGLYNEAINNTPAGGKVPYYPPYSGSNRSNVNILPIFKAAFIMKQLLEGRSFENIQYQATAKDLVHLAPIFLQGTNAKIEEEILDSWEEVDVLLRNKEIDSMVPSKEGESALVHSGRYNPITNTLLVPAPGEEAPLYAFFDRSKEELIPGSNYMTNYEIVTWDKKGSQIDRLFFNGKPRTEERLLEIEKNFDSEKLKQGDYVSYILPTYLRNFADQAPLREESIREMGAIVEAHDIFLEAANGVIKRGLSAPQNTSTESASVDFKTQAEKQRKELIQHLEAGDKEAALILSMESIRSFYQEFNQVFLESESVGKALIQGIFSKLNIMLYGPPGSGKTMISKLYINKVLDALNVEQLGLLAENLFAKLKEGGLAQGDYQSHIKQFSPMTPESEIVGYQDFEALREGKGLKYVRDKSLSAKQNVIALLDEWEKASPALKTAILSIFNERAVFDGIERIALNLIAIILATNSTPGEFIQSMGPPSTAFPVHSRIQKKVYAFNKMTPENLEKFLNRINEGFDFKVHTDLPIFALEGLREKYEMDSSIFDNVIVEAVFDFKKWAMEKSETSRKAFSESRGQEKDYYVQTQGEDRRRTLSILGKELIDSILINRVLFDPNYTELAQLEKIPFRLDDLIALVELFVTGNSLYSVKTKYTNTGVKEFYIEERDKSAYDGRLTSREDSSLKDIYEEMHKMVSILNSSYGSYIISIKEEILRNPNLFPDLFSSQEERRQWLIDSGFSAEEVKKYYP